MNKEPGFIYILANSAMPDLVKVGKTARSPNERAKELSSLTNIPTPFIVVYEQLVDDCSFAEHYIHTVLNKMNYREAENREFFRASVSEVVKIVSSIPVEILNNNLVETKPQNIISDSTQEACASLPWLDIWKKAIDYSYGTNECIEDLEEALKFYIEATKLGCLPAYEKIGDIYLMDFDNKKEASFWLKKGISLGNYFCYGSLGIIFNQEGKYDNFHKCYKILFSEYKKTKNTILKEYGKSIEQHVHNYVNFCFFLPHSEPNLEPDSNTHDFIKKYKDSLIKQFESDVIYYNSNYKDDKGVILYIMPRLKAALEWMYNKI